MKLWNGNTWEQCKIDSHAGKATGGYKNWQNFADEKGNGSSMDWLNVRLHPIEVLSHEISKENESDEKEGVEVYFTMASKMDIQKEKIVSDAKENELKK